jgi:hypothetical protein
MSDTEELPVASEAEAEEPVASEAAEEPVASEAAEEAAEEPVVSEVASEAAEEAAEEPVASEAAEEPVASEAEAEAPVASEAASEAVEAAPAEPTASEAAEEPVASEVVEETEETEEAAEPTASEAVEQVASDIREILAPVESVNEVEVSSPEVVNDNICSLKTLVDVLRKWSGNEVRGRQIEDLLKDGTDVDESLDDIEKVVEIVHSWVKEGGRKRDATKNLSNINGYELLGESKNLSEEEKVESLKRLTELVINLHN